MGVIDQPTTSCYGRAVLRRNVDVGALRGFPHPPGKDSIPPHVGEPAWGARARRSRASSTPSARSISFFGLAFLLVPMLLAPILGCGPVEYINQVGNKAASAVSAAKLAEADRYAPYEYTAAAEYLHKAREEAGHAEYEDAIEYGRKAEELANRARALTVERLAKEGEANYQPKSQNEEPGSAGADPAAAAAKQGTRERAAKTPGTE